MIIIGMGMLDKFKRKHSDVRSQIDSWVVEVKDASWETSMDVKNKYPKASLVGNNNVVFNFGWNKYRLWVQASYKNKVLIIKEVGTHKEYDNWKIH